MILPLSLLFLAMFIAMKSSKDVLLQSYCSVSQTQVIKGFFVVTIFLSHFCSYVHFDNMYDSVVTRYTCFWSQRMVVPFLFYSGYGIFEQVKKKGNGYIGSFPKKRILKTLLHFDLAMLLFLVLNNVLGNSISIADFLLSLIAWSSIGNSNWFVFAILFSYVIVYIGFLLFKVDLKKVAVFVLVMTVAYIVFINQFKIGSQWYNTILAFPMGCFFSLYRKFFEKNISKKMLFIGGGLSMVVLIACSTIFNSSSIQFDIAAFFDSQIALLAFLCAMISFSLCVRLNSNTLSWFGAYVFEIYILQRLPMNFGKHMHWNEQNIYMYFLFCFVVTLLLSIGFKKMTKRIDAFLFKG